MVCEGILDAARITVSSIRDMPEWFERKTEKLRKRESREMWLRGRSYL